MFSGRIKNEHIGNKAKEQISKQIFQENKPSQIFQKTSISDPLKMFVFRKIWRALFSWNTHLEIHPFALLPKNIGLKCVTFLWCFHSLTLFMIYLQEKIF